MPHINLIISLAIIISELRINLLHQPPPEKNMSGQFFGVIFSRIDDVISGNHSNPRAGWRRKHEGFGGTDINNERGNMRRILHLQSALRLLWLPETTNVYLYFLWWLQYVFCQVVMYCGGDMVFSAIVFISFAFRCQLCFIQKQRFGVEALCRSCQLRIDWHSGEQHSHKEFKCLASTVPLLLQRILLLGVN